MMDPAAMFQYERKVKTVEELCKLIGPRPRARKVIMCHGVFDIVHPGHVRHLIYAKSKGDVLVVSVTADEHIAKGNVRPYVPETLRAINLAAFEMVDYVIIDRDPTPLANLRQIQPDYYAKGYEYVAGSLHPKTQEELRVLESYGGEVLFTPGDIVYSSSRLIDQSPPDIASDKLLVLMKGEGLTFDDLRDAAVKLSGIRVHVVGDTIVDSYTQCSMIGGVAKTPTMSVRFESKQDFTGGAAVVAKHLRAAGGDVVFSTVLGDDALKDQVLEDLAAHGIRCLPIVDPTRPTTSKNAIVVAGYRLLKIDTLDNRSVSEKVLKQLTLQVSGTAADAVVYSDFRHGIFDRHTIPDLVAAIPRNAFRAADSQVASRWGNILEFKGFDLITPNEREARAVHARALQDAHAEARRPRHDHVPRSPARRRPQLLQPRQLRGARGGPRGGRRRAPRLRHAGHGGDRQRGRGGDPRLRGGRHRMRGRRQRPGDPGGRARQDPSDGTLRSLQLSGRAAHR